MRVIPIHPHLRPVAGPPSPRREEGAAALRRLLLGECAVDAPMPPIADVLSALLALAEGRREKSTLPLGTTPAELVLVRRGPRVLVSYLVVDGAPELRALDRPVPLHELLPRCAALATELASADSDPTSRALTLRLADRALEATIADTTFEPEPVRHIGGAHERPSARVPLAFGFEAEIVPCADAPRASTASSDVHALLFRGSLFVWARGRRIPLLRGPIMLAALRMVAATRALCEAAAASRPANVRLRAGTFVVGVRLDRDGTVALTLGSDDEGPLTIPELRLEEAALPILRLASDLVRALVSVDRSQSRNLRVTALRDEVRALRRLVRAGAPKPASSIVHDDPDRLRASAAATPVPPPRASVAPPRTLRFERRWQAEVEGLDAASTFLCGDRLIVATPRHTVAFARDDGEILWSHREPAAASFMTGRVLVRLGNDGRVVLCDPRDGEAYAEALIAPRVGAPTGLLAGGGAIPPVAVLAEGRDRLSAIDLRNGELRWRFDAPGRGSFSLRRAGRILLVASGDAALCAVDVATGELLWRFVAEGARFACAPAIDGDVVIAASGEPGGSEGALYAVDLFSGRGLWERALDAAPASGPIVGPGLTAIALGGRRRAALAAFSPADGELRWMIRDPGAALGAACMALDSVVLVNAPAGLTAIGAADGAARWTRRLSHPVADDVPRRLEPVLRGGALFVPSARVHVLRPNDGTSIGDPLPCELIPDWMRVDERGWVFVAEESGHVCAMAPRAHLSLVR